MIDIFSSYIITESNLGAQCAEIFLTEGHQVLGIISNNQDVIKWALDHNIPYFLTLKEFENTKPAKTFDYLFSIVNSQILSPQLLEYPRYIAINYHDAPLPKYAGVHATSWAILNNEKNHGVSWHIMSSLVDTGDILKQVIFPIEPDETALTLNLICYTQAIETFKLLVKDITEETIHKYPQNLQDRSYFGAHQKPQNAGIVDWNTSAQNIDRLYRAFYFGNYQNKLATFKLLIDQQIFFPHKLEVLQKKTKAEPGTIVKIQTNALQITTETEDVLIGDITDARGNSWTISSLANDFNFYEGYPFSTLDKSMERNLYQQLIALSPYEDYWVNTLLHSTSTNLSFMDSNSKKSKNQHLQKEQGNQNCSFITYEIDEKIIKDAFEKFKEASFVDILSSVFMSYLSRLDNKNTLSISYTDPSLKQLTKSLDPFLSLDIPLIIEDFHFLTGEEAVQKFIEKKANVLKHKTFSLDIKERYPSLKERTYSKSDIKINIVKPEEDILKTQHNYFLEINISSEGEKYTLAFSSELVEQEKQFIESIPGHIVTLLINLLKEPSAPIQTLSLLMAQEQHQLLIEWNDTQTEYPEHKTVHQLFEEQVKKTPDNIAVVYEDQQLTYQELNEKANQLAHYLRGLGVGPDTLVAIAVDRSLEMIIGVLGILKAGGAYVPLDPNYPQERLQFMLDDTQAPILITQVHLRDRFKEYPHHCLCLELDKVSKDLRVINEEEQYAEQREGLDNEFNSVTLQNWRTLSTHPHHNPTSITLPHNLAYVIYTSGSTGKPKGVLIENSSLSNHMLWMKEKYNFSYKDKILQRTAYSFDASIWELFMPLLSGAQLIIPNSEVSKNPVMLVDLILRRNITKLQLVPAVLKIFSNNERLKELDTIKQLFIGGDALLTEDIYHLPYTLRSKIVNLYGPTEASIDTTSYFYDPKENRSIIPIGRPISNTQIYILDAYQNPVPIGVSGEIYIGGAGLARGYLNRPDLTAEKFIPNPFANDKNNTHQSLRLYRTGDLARYLPDGNIEFMGRIDDQVKIRGFRIELGEIESVLTQHGDVNQAVVVAREDEPGHKHLVAYVIPQESIISALDTETVLTSSDRQEFAVLKGDKLPALTEDLRNYLALSLPDYMIPSFFVFINKTPLTPNGKIDRKALPAPDLSLRQVEEQYVAPSTPLEQELCTIWAEVLRIEKIGIHDNFFKLGGHSLLATQVISRIRHAYAINLPLRALFEHPTIHILIQDIQQLTGEKAFSVIPHIVAEKRPDVLPLSFAQQRLWFLDQLLPDNALYNIPLALKLTGSLNLNAFEKALNALIDRHESLRTVFPATQGEARQLIMPLLVLKIEDCLEDLSALTENEQQACVETLASQEANAPFNLSSGPLIRLKLIKNSPQEHILLLTMHHIISDGWSMGIFFKELSEMYDAYQQGQKPNLPALPIQYADFALWQRQWLQGEVLETQLSYWKQQLSDIPDLLELPTDKPRPKELTYQGDSYHYTLSKEIKNQLNQFSQQQGTSLFMTLLALFQVLLYRYTGQKEIVVGSPIANRHYQEIEGLIGFFVNTLALKTSFDDNESFLDILYKVKETTLQAYQHQDVPFEQLVDYLNIERKLNRNPVFQIMFDLQNTAQDGEKLNLHNIQIAPTFSNYPIAKFDLSVFAFEHEEGISIGFEYATDLFEEETIKRFGTHFEELIKNTLKHPSHSIYDIPLLTIPEQHQLLMEWNSTKVDYPGHQTIHQLFEEQVEKTPNNIAVVYEDQELTYQQLNQKANQLAHYLRTLGVGPDILVAIAVDRSLEMIIGLLGILKAGGAYVPLDPDYPQERLQFMLEDTNVPILITQTHLRDRFKDYSHHFLCLDLEQVSQDLRIINEELCEEQDNECNSVMHQHWTTLSTQPHHNPTSIILPHHLAYVIYTSGSTGKPKGVLITHYNASNLIKTQSSIFNIKEDKRVLQFASLSFDAAVSEILTTLTNGALLYLVSRNTLLDKNSFIEFICNYSINLMTLPPSFLNNLHPQNLPTLKTLVTAGEIINKKTVEIWHPGRCLINAYGPTEGTVCASLFLYDYLEWSSAIIGRPISNTQIYILDAYQNPVPIGVSGEIYIGGAGLARGYLNRPDLTAEKFIPNPFANEKNHTHQSLRLYRTGDLARYLSDGNIEFMGRIDDQVKIRGFRIELGEIESVLTQHGNVNQAVVVAREDEPGHKHLAAYVMIPQESIMSALDTETVLISSDRQEFAVLKGGKLPALTEDLRNYLALSLPNYMIPSFFVFIDKVPLTPNGKIDRKALPAPDLSLRQVEEQYVAPSTPLEQKLCTIWAEVLRIEKIGIHDNFFRIGGDSIISIQLVAKARQKGIYLAVKDIFNNPTVAALALVTQSKEDTLTLKPEQGLVKGEIPLTPIQHWFFEQGLKNKHHFNQVTLLQVHEQIDPSLFHQVFEILVSHHDALRCRYNQEFTENWKQNNLDHEESVSLWNIFDLTHTSDQELPLQIEHQANILQQSLNIETGPLIKVALFQCGKERPARLLIVIHHLVVDGVSWRILLEDLNTVYLGFYQRITQKLPSVLILIFAVSSAPVRRNFDSL